MAHETAPAFQCYSNDLLADVLVHDVSVIGALMVLRAFAWREGSIPSDEGQLARILHLSAAAFASIWTAIRDRCEPSNGRLVFADLEKYRARLATKRKQKADAAAARWAKDKRRAAKAAPLELVPPPKPKAARADVAKLIDHYRARWIESRKPGDGKPPAMTRADNMQAAALVREHGIEQAIAWVDRYLTDDDPWLAGQGYALRHAASRINGYRAGVKPSGARAKPSLAEPRAAASETKVEEL